MKQGVRRFKNLKIARIGSSILLPRPGRFVQRAFCKERACRQPPETRQPGAQAARRTAFPPPASPHPARPAARNPTGGGPSQNAGQNAAQAAPAIGSPEPAQIAPPLQTQSRLAGPGGARAPSSGSALYCSGAVLCRCERIVAITSGSSMLARILSLPPQRAQRSIWTPNTRFPRAACCAEQTRRGTSSGASAVAAPVRLLAPD
jgi:hypothetical protein